jgi:hypothetical protein
MSAKLIKSKNSTAVYIIITVVIIVVAFLLLGDRNSLRGMMHGNGQVVITRLNWGQILIGAGIGFLLGLLVGRRR